MSLLGNLQPPLEPKMRNGPQVRLHMFNCKYSITRYTNRNLFFSQNNVSNKSDQYNFIICLKQCLISLCYKTIRVCLKVLVKFQETYLIPNHEASHSSCQTSETYLEVKGVRSEKGTRPDVGLVLRASFTALSAASFPRIPIDMSRDPHKNSFLFVCINFVLIFLYLY